MTRLLAIALIAMMSFAVQAQSPGASDVGTSLTPGPGPHPGPGPGPHPGPGPGPHPGPGPGPHPGPGPGPHPGPGPGPGPRPGPGPHPGPPGPGPGAMDGCNQTFDGGYSAGGRATFMFQRVGRNVVDVYIYNNGYQWYGRGTCDSRGFDVNISGYEHVGSFSYTPFRVDGISGTEYVNGRPYANFSGRAR